MNRTMMILSLATLLTACGDKDDDTADTDVGTDSDTDGGTDTETDDETDTETDTDTDTDTDTEPEALIDFDDSGVTYGCVGFGGGEDCAVEADPTDATNNVLRISKSDAAELWAGSTVITDASDNSIDTLNITATNTAYTIRVWSPVAGVPIRVKIEDKTDPTKSVETEATITNAETWETLTFDFASEASGTAALDPSYTFDRLSIFPNFGTTGADGGGGTYYFDSISESF